MILTSTLDAARSQCLARSRDAHADLVILAPESGLFIKRPYPLTTCQSL